MVRDSAQAAVVALADAEAGDLDEAAQVDVVADVGATELIGAGEEFVSAAGSSSRSQWRISSWVSRGIATTPDYT